MTGSTLDAFDYVRRPVLEYLSRQLGMPAPELTTLRALYRRQMTLFLHSAGRANTPDFAGTMLPISLRSSTL